MQVRILDLDGSVTRQSRLVIESAAEVVPLQDWGPRLRMACSWGRFRRFGQSLDRCLDAGPGPTVTFYGSGDFHHVSLALVRRITTPFNLLVLDKHPDWMCGIPFLHCGTWLRHAARLPLLRRVYHVGGELDFDNAWRWLAPCGDLRRGKVAVFPAMRRFTRGPWRRIRNVPVRAAGRPVTEQRVEELLRPFAPALARWPLYVSLDKDVMTAADAVVNWDSGQLRTGGSDGGAGRLRRGGAGGTAGGGRAGGLVPRAPRRGAPSRPALDGTSGAGGRSRRGGPGQRKDEPRPAPESQRHPRPAPTPGDTAGPRRRAATG